MTRPFGAGGLSTSKSSAVHALKWKSSLRSGINQIFTRQMFSLSVWCIFNRSAVFCLFIVSNSQRGFIVCEGFFGEGVGGWKSFLFEAVHWGLCGNIKRASIILFPPILLNLLAYSSCPHYSYVGYWEGCMMVIHDLCPHTESVLLTAPSGFCFKKAWLTSRWNEEQLLLTAIIVMGGRVIWTLWACIYVYNEVEAANTASLL